MATKTAVDQSKLCKITNTSGTDIVVGLPVTTAETRSANSIVSYSQDFEILPVSKGGTVIKNGDSDTVTLDRTHKDPNTGKDVYSLGYDLLISGSTWLNPVANIGVIQDFDDDGNDFFDPETITAANKTAMQQTSDFYQTIAAYPDSQLAKNYVAAMTNTGDDADGKADGSDGSGDAVDNSISSGVAAFFKSTKNYQQVTLPDIVALESYYNRFPFVWAQFATDTVTYFLYSSDGSKTSFQGALSIKKPGTIDITKVNAGYTCQFLPAVDPADTSKTDVDSSKAQNLTYADGVFVNDTTSDVPGIALKGTFQLKRTFTKDPNDTKIIVVITGTINGQTAIGFDQAQATKPDDTTQDWLNALFHPKTAAEIFNSVMTILGALMMLHFVGTTLFGIGKWIKQKIQAKEPVTKKDLQAQKESVEAEFKAQRQLSLKKVSGGKEQLPDSPEDGLSQAVTEKGNLSDMVSAGQTETNLIKMIDNLKTPEEYVPEDSTGTMQGRINESAGNIRDAYTKISTSELADLKATLADLRPQLQELSAKVTKLNTDMQKMVAEQEKTAMDENVKDMQNVQEEIDNENTTNEEDGKTPTDDNPNADGIDLPVE